MTTEKRKIMKAEQILESIRKRDDGKHIWVGLEDIIIEDILFITDLRVPARVDLSFDNVDFRGGLCIEGREYRTVLRNCNCKNHMGITGINRGHVQLTKCVVDELFISGSDLSRISIYDSKLKKYNIDSVTNATELLMKNVDGWFDPITYMDKHFEKCAEGYIVYKVFNVYHAAPPSWDIKKGSIIYDIPNSNPFSKCGYGINVGTREYVRKDNNYPGGTFFINNKNNLVWKCLIKWEWLLNTVVPFNTDGKIRCSRLKLMESMTLYDFHNTKFGGIWQ